MLRLRANRRIYFMFFPLAVIHVGTAHAFPARNAWSVLQRSVAQHRELFLNASDVTLIWGALHVRNAPRRSWQDNREYTRPVHGDEHYPDLGRANRLPSPWTVNSSIIRVSGVYCIVLPDSSSKRANHVGWKLNITCTVLCENMNSYFPSVLHLDLWKLQQKQ